MIETKKNKQTKKQTPNKQTFILNKKYSYLYVNIIPFFINALISMVNFLA